METVLYLAHTEADGSLSRHSLEALTTAQATAAGLNATLVAGIFGAHTSAASQSDRRLRCSSHPRSRSAGIR